MNRTRLLVLAAAGVLALGLATLGFAGTSASSTIELGALMDTKQELPKPKATSGVGLFTGTVTGSTLRWRMTFVKLTGAAGAAHIHLAKAGKANPAPAVALCGPCKSGQRGTAEVPAAALRAIRSGGAYVNVHTAANGAGEIRGQIAVVG
jgi:hypothetical protein